MSRRRTARGGGDTRRVDTRPPRGVERVAAAGDHDAKNRLGRCRPETVSPIYSDVG